MPKVRLRVPLWLATFSGAISPLAHPCFSQLFFFQSVPHSFHSCICKNFAQLLWNQSPAHSCWKNREVGGLPAFDVQMRRLHPGRVGGTFRCSDLQTILIFSATSKSLIRNYRFACSLFSADYKFLFPQLLCFVIYTNRRGVPSSERCSGTPGGHPPMPSSKRYFLPARVTMLQNRRSA
jgi:hypothetical protein